MKKALFLLLLNASFLFPSNRWTEFIGGDSLLFNKKIIEIERLLKNDATREVFIQALELIEPDIFKKISFDKKNAPLDKINYFAFMVIIEKLLDRCDNIITELSNNLTAQAKSNASKPAITTDKQPKHMPLKRPRELEDQEFKQQTNFATRQSYNASIEKQPENPFKHIPLKNFKELEDQKDEYQFLKLYRFLRKTIQTANKSRICIPKSFNMNDYLKGSTPADCFYENCKRCNFCNYKDVHLDPTHLYDEEEEDTLRLARLNLLFSDPIILLAERADKLEIKYNRH